MSPVKFFEPNRNTNDELVKSSSSIDLRITPILKKTILGDQPDATGKRISWRNEIAEFQDNDEYSLHLSNILPHFPEIASQEKPEELLKKLTSISQFIPLFANISAIECLKITHENIKKNFLSDELIKICAYYLYNKCLSDKEACSKAAILLKATCGLNEYPSSDAIDICAEDKLIFQDKYHRAMDSCSMDSLKNFVKTLFELIPLEEVAEIRLHMDKLKVVNALNFFLDPSERFEDCPIPAYKFYRNSVSNLNDWLETKKDRLQTLTKLNLSQTKIQRLPKQLLPYLSGVEEVLLTESTIEDPVILIDLLQLPSLKHLDFSSNEFVDREMFQNISALPLKNALTAAKNLKTFYFYGNPFSFYDLPDLIDACSELSIDLALDAFSEEEDSLDSICRAINEHLPDEYKISIPAACSLHRDEFREGLFNALKEEKIKAAIRTVENLDLSQKDITFFPEELVPFLDSVESVDFSGNFYEGIDIFPAIQNLLKLNNLTSIYLLNNVIDNEFLEQLAPDIFASNIKEIHLGNDLVRLEKIPAFLSECESIGIVFFYTLAQKPKNLIDFCNTTGIFDPPIEYSTSAYHFVLEYLPSFFSRSLINKLDLSQASTDTIPEEILPYFSEVLSVIYSGKQDSLAPEISMIKSILKLPKIREVNFSNNGLTDRHLSFLIEDFKQCSSLKMLNLLDNPWDPSTPLNQEIIQYCYENKIHLLRPYSWRELDFLVVLDHIEQMFMPKKTLIPKIFINEKHIIEELPKCLEPHKNELSEIKHLDFSNIKINNFPTPLISYLSGVTSVNLNNTTPDPIPSANRPKGIRNHQLLASLLNLPNLEELDFSNNYISLSSFICLRSLLQKTDNKLKKINFNQCTIEQNLIEKLINLCNEFGVCASF